VKAGAAAGVEVVPRADDPRLSTAYMPTTFNLRHLDKRDLHLVGELSAADLDLEDIDELVEMREPLRYDLVAEKFNDRVLVQGKLQSVLTCQCARCLSEFRYRLELTSWICDLPLEGEDKVLVTNDCVDLTPYIREDILLAFPQHPLCGQECRGLPDAARILQGSASVEGQSGNGSSAWSELNKLKF
jgi:uncharacterized protein